MAALRPKPAKRALGQRPAARAQQIPNRIELRQQRGVWRGINEIVRFGVGRGPDIIGWQDRTGPIASGQQPHRQGRPDQPGQPMIARDPLDARRVDQHVHRMLDPHEIRALGNGDDTVGEIRAPAIGADLARLNGPVHLVENRLGLRHGQAVLVQQQQIDPVAPQPRQTAVNRGQNAFRRGLVPGQLFGPLVKGDPDLGHDQRVWTSLQRGGQQPFGMARAIGRRRIKKPDATAQRRVNGADRFRIVGIGVAQGLIPREHRPADGPAAHAQGGNIGIQKTHAPLLLQPRRQKAMKAASHP